MLLMLLAVLVIMAMTLFDIVTREPALVRFPKLLWVIVVVLSPLIGCALWFVIGRRPAPVTASRTIVVHESPMTSARPHPSAPLSTEEQLAALEREIETDRRTRRIAELEAELRRRRGTGGEPDGLTPLRPHPGG